MKIIDVETIILELPEKEDKQDSSQDALIVKVHTDEGITGIGEIDTNPLIAKAVIEAPMSHHDSRGVKELLIGEDPFEIEKIWEKIYKGTTHYGRRGVGIQVMGGIDIALWDIVGKVTQQPIYRLLGGCFRDRLPAYASTLFPDTPEELAERARSFIKRGFRAIKFGWGSFGQSLSRDIKLIKTAREAIGENAKLIVDAGCCWNAASAIQLVKKIEKYDIFWLEDPLSSDDIAGYAKLTRVSTIPISAGEMETTRYPYRDLIERANLDIIQPDVTRVGGISEAKKIALMAYERGVLFVPHCWSTNILTAATLHLLAAIPQDSWFEFAISDSPLRNNLTQQPFGIDEEGFITVPKEPGLGIELNQEISDKYSK